MWRDDSLRWWGVGVFVHRGDGLLVVMPDHPATASLPGTWTRSDEWYDLRDLQAGLSILLEVDELSYKTPEENPLPDPRPGQ